MSKSIENGLRRILESMPIDKVVEFCVYRLAKNYENNPYFILIMICFQKMGFLTSKFYRDKIINYITDNHASLCGVLVDLDSDFLAGDNNE